MSRALVVFSETDAHIFAKYLRPGFKHCFVVVKSEGYFIRLDYMAGKPALDVVCGSDYDLAGFYRREGLYVVETSRRVRSSFWPLATANCVGLVKTVLGLRAPFVITPYQLYRKLTRGGLLPGKSFFDPPKPDRLPPPAPAAPPPEREDPAVLEAARRQRQQDLRRRGRASTILTPSRGVGAAPLGRPAAAGDQLGTVGT